MVEKKEHGPSEADILIGFIDQRPDIILGVDAVVACLGNKPDQVRRVLDEFSLDPVTITDDEIRVVDEEIEERMTEHGEQL